MVSYCFCSSVSCFRLIEFLTKFLGWLYNYHEVVCAVLLTLMFHESFITWLNCTRKRRIRAFLESGGKLLDFFSEECFYDGIPASMLVMSTKEILERTDICSQLFSKELIL